MAVILMTLALITCGKGIQGKGINSVIGPYTAFVERFYNCQPDNRPLPWTWNLRVTHFNPYKPKELQRLTDTRSNNQWKENAFVFNFIKNGCRALKDNAPGYYEQVLKKREVKGACCFKPGVYEVNNASVDWSFPNVPILPYGRYRVRAMFGKADDDYTCSVADARIVPKSD
ncbi:uncharacterized protein LOC113213116 isoform X2 [Frankliniella occidentalis]|uniref:Uncharacterized protein LOC113213116 isoform X2 n=1 Tax=Frankliniella occidentalis TaxID=133901 RepID=A0A6J1T2S1_FRAOC|nr:uncharacterized protein LOC113213116 isoform X2 [Frankliniella occidentalis]